MMKAYFNELSDYVQSLAADGEVLTSGFSAESSEFVRFNRSAIRQATSVEQARWTLSLIQGERRLDAAITLSGQPEEDRRALKGMLGGLRDDIADVPEDPYLIYPTEATKSERESRGELPDIAAVIDEALAAARGLDLVGLYAGGPMYEGFSSSLGQRSWHHVDNFNFDWCLYHDRDKAVKTSYAGARWDSAVFAERMSAAREKLARLALPPRKLSPGHYRAYLTPAALTQPLFILSWTGFGLQNLRTKHTPLIRMADGGERFDPRVTIAENTAEGLMPSFQRDGFERPGRVDLIRNGKLEGALVSPRSAKEFGVLTNGANREEMPESIDMAAGDLPEAEVLKALDRGIYISNLWYVNISDRSACRLTGMTRFATFWVEGGEIRAPLEVMRFDDTLYRMLGSELLELTRERDFMLDGHTYGARNGVSYRAPGVLLRDFKLTL